MSAEWYVHTLKFLGKTLLIDRFEKAEAHFFIDFKYCTANSKNFVFIKEFVHLFPCLSVFFPCLSVILFVISNR